MAAARTVALNPMRVAASNSQSRALAPLEKHAPARRHTQE